MKCPSLCLILVWCAHAAPNTSVTIAFNPAQIAQPVAIRAAVSPAGGTGVVLGGTVAFTVDGVTIAGCEAVRLQDGEIGFPVAICHTSFSRLGTFSLTAAYSGYGSSTPSSATASLTVGKVSAGVYVAFTPEAPVYAGPLTVGALVLGAEGVAPPQGTVTFLEGGVTLGTQTVGSDGHARMALTLSAGPHTVLAQYDGDANYQAGRAVAATVTVMKSPAVVAVSSTPAQIGQTATITASVQPPTSAGTVAFTPVSGCGAARVQNGVATCRTTFARLGEVAITANYSGDDNTLPGAASMKLTVGRVVAGIYLAFTPPAPVVGETVQLSGLALGATGVAPPTGTMVFSDGTAPVAAIPLDSGGHATASVTLGVGSHPITATYNGDTNYGTSQASAAIVVAKGRSTTTLTATTGGPFTAVVEPVAPASGAPTGSVRFLREGAAIATVPLTPMGSASSATLATASQTGTLTAEYAGDGNFNGSVSAPVAVAPPRVQMTLASDRNPAASGQAVTFTVALTPNPGIAAPGGSVQFTSDGASLGSVAVSAGRASLTVTLAPGSHTVAANYSGDATYPAASASLTQVVSVATAALSLTGSAQTTVFGQPVTFTAQLTGGSAGTVRFSDGATSIGAAKVVVGVASLTVAALGAGVHTIAADWAGDGSFGAASAQLLYTVSKARTATTLALSGGVAVANVVVIAPGAGSPGGSVRFVSAVSNTPLAGSVVSGGVATATLTQIGDPVVAVYTGDDNFVGGVSPVASPLTAANAASYASDAFAPDEIVTLFGPNLGGAVAAKVKDSTGAAYSADFLYAAPEQAAFVLPHAVAAGPALLTVGGLSTMITVTTAAPGLFTGDSSGKGTPVGQALRVRADGTEVSGAFDAIDLGDPGDSVYLVLYGTGIRHYQEKPLCTIGGRPVDVVFAGAQEAFPGLDQVNLLLPAALRGAGPVDLVLTVDSVASNAVTVVLR